MLLRLFAQFAHAGVVVELLQINFDKYAIPDESLFAILGSLVQSSHAVGTMLSCVCCVNNSSAVPPHFVVQDVMARVFDVLASSASAQTNSEALAIRVLMKSAVYVTRVMLNKPLPQDVFTAANSFFARLRKQPGTQALHSSALHLAAALVQNHPEAMAASLVCVLTMIRYSKLAEHDGIVEIREIIVSTGNTFSGCL